MSKGDSHLFTNTTGAGQELIEEVIAKGGKISPDEVVLITKDPSGKIVWLENGNALSGMQHIIDKHGLEFAQKGIDLDTLADYILEAVYQGHIVGSQGRRNPRTVYEFKYYGVVQRIAVQVSNNGYIVSANPRSMKEV